MVIIHTVFKADEIDCFELVSFKLVKYTTNFMASFKINFSFVRIDLIKKLTIVRPATLAHLSMNMDIGYFDYLLA